ncbi:HNH endonuclease signature motif containing protein [Sphingopyxis sp. 113P3]|uniref:HNH endonuclease signature motif containing protein n=1 Tax=Sphingopyxis sp. (strain 113P3) TaxID=292913 RepID=UPI003FA387F6
MLAHRVACTIAHGSPPEGKASALHSCDNPPCCNPAHLRWGSHKENTADAIERDRASPPPKNTSYRRRDTQPKGADVWNQSLTEDKVREIWRLHLAGGMTTSQIAEAVDATRHAVTDVARGRSWRHLPDAPSVESLKAGGVRRGYNQFSDLLETCAK